MSDPANPVPYRQRPISPTYPGGDWRRWEVADQRFVDGRPDVLTLHERAARSRSHGHRRARRPTLFASTSGTDCDFVVKLIDVYPENAQPNAWNAEAGPEPGALCAVAQRLRAADRDGGPPRPLQHELRAPRPLPPNTPVEWKIPLRDHDHVFLKGHRLMVQVQSTWFPLIDRNPQKFVPSIYAGGRRRLRQGHAARLLHAGPGLTNRAAGRPVAHARTARHVAPRTAAGYRR